MVLILSVVSLLADVASEMLYPVLPLFLKDIGFSVLLIGALEGLAAFAAAISKGYFGKLSDEKGWRLPFVRWGYFLSALSKPLMAVAVWPAWIFLVRSVDRLGKGVRTAARDALLSQEATPETKGRVFGFHRGMDTLGAALGPLLALLLLTLFPANYQALFLIAGVPGLLAVLLTFLVKEKKSPTQKPRRKGFFSFFFYWKVAPAEYRKLVAGLLLFALFNSSDMFLLVKTKELTGSDTTTLLAYITYNFVFALAAFPFGNLADRFGFKTVFSVGLLLFAAAYLIMASNASVTVLFVAFGIYGLYAAATEGVVKAWISNLSPKSETGTALGFYSSCESIALLFASFITGGLWMAFGSNLAFYLTASVALLVFFYFLLVYRSR